MNGVPDNWVQQVITEASEYFNDVDKRERAADKRNVELVRVHRDGWQLVARSLDTGLRLIADAIRDHGRG